MIPRSLALPLAALYFAALPAAATALTAFPRGIAFARRHRLAREGRALAPLAGGA
jgi:hypothetical protein